MLELLEMLKPHATIISALSAFISAIAVIISTWFVIWSARRKTRQDLIDELKTEMRIYVSNKYGFNMYPKDVEPMFRSLPKEYQDPKYKDLHRAAYHELRTEGRLEHNVPFQRKKTE